MNQPLIFTERRLLPRIIDVLLTLIAWVGFLYLIYKGLITALAHSPYMGVRPFFTTLDTVTFYILVALVNGLVLIGWAKYNQFRFRVERRSRRPGLEDHELAESLRNLSISFLIFSLFSADIFRLFNVSSNCSASDGVPSSPNSSRI